jgi:uncharacterized protein YkwD
MNKGWGNELTGATRVVVLLLFLLQATAAWALDLGSTEATMHADLGGTESIMTGGRPQVVQAGQLVTPAELVAATQVLSAGRQSLVVSGAGNAVGGSFALNGLGTTPLNGLTLPQGVSALNDFAHMPAVNVGGALVNSGNLYAYTSNAQVNAAVVNAQSLLNNSSGVISSITPHHLLPRGASSNLDLHLNIVEEVVNRGTISSSRDLYVRTNAGTIDGTGGVMEALSGNIIVEVPNATKQSTLRMTGGDFLSQNLNINAGRGSVYASLGEVTGWVNITAANANFGAHTSHLKLGELVVTDDPTYFNSLGSLSLLTVSPTNGQPLALIAAGDVTVQGGTIDTTASAGGDGGAILIVAGANFTSNGATGNTTGDSITTLTLSGSVLAGNGSASGGKIDLTGVTSINSNARLNLDNSLLDGGDITLIAFSGSGSESGTIDLGTTGSITTVGAGGTNGNILVIAGATSNPASGAAIRLPAMFTGWAPMSSQSGSSGGNVTIHTATPQYTGVIQVLNGAVQSGSGTFVAAAGTQPTSVVIGARGGTGSAMPVHISIVGWQQDATQYALAQLNAARAAEGLGPLTLNAALTEAATQQAQYLAQTQHYTHLTLNGATPGDRGKAVGINVNSTGYAENVAISIGAANTARSTYDDGLAAMLAEPLDEGPNHHTNIRDHSFVGIGFAMVNETWYYVENFTQNNPGSPSLPNLVVPVYGGVGGGAGLVAVSSTNNTVAAVGSSGVLPTSINAGTASVTVRAGGSVQADGAILANGKPQDLFQHPFQSDTETNAGNVSITAGGNVTLHSIQASGGAGLKSMFGPTTSAGGAGGTVSVISQTGSINILPGAPCAPCLAISAAGGAGGQSFEANSAGGAGGAGGSVTLSAPGGNISVSAIEVGGGGGAGGSGGATGGVGGAGGAGGTISMNASGTITVEHYLNASGGGGGAGGGGVVDGGAGGSMGQAGSANEGSTVAGGAGGAGGSIDIQASAVRINGSPRDLWEPRFTVNSNGDHSILALGNGGSVSVATTGISQADLDSNADYSSTVRTITAVLSSTFEIGGNASGGGTLGSVAAGSQAGAITLNGTALNSPVTSGAFSTPASDVTITRDGNPVVVSNGTLLTPAEWAAVVQVARTGTQPLTLGALGQAVGGSLTWTSDNVPAGGFTTLVVPPSVTLFNNASTLTISTSATINGIMDTTNQPFSVSMFVPVLTVNGSIVTASPGLSVNSLSVVNIGANGQIASNTTLGGGLDLAINSLAPDVSLRVAAFNLSINASGSIAITESDNVNVVSAVATNLSIFASNSMSLTNDITVPGRVTLTSEHFALNADLTANEIHVRGIVSPLNQGTFVSGTGLITSNNTRIATTGSLHLNGSLTFAGVTDLVANSPNSRIELQSGAQVTNLGSLTLHTTSFINEGTVVGPFTLNSGSGAGSMQNPNGDVVLTSGFTFAGSDLLIIASGNIRAASSSPITINLSSTTQGGGTLTMLAGFSSTALIAGSAPLRGFLEVTGPSSTGGSIELPKLTIKTGSTCLNCAGGDVTAVATSGANSTGSIILGAINTSAGKGTAGGITLVGEGGVQTSALTASGQVGGSIRLIGAAGTISPDVLYVSGTSIGPAAPIESAPVAGGGAAIFVNGAITTTGTQGAGGAVTISADSPVEIKGRVTTTGRTGGTVDISSLSNVIVRGAISTSAIAVASTAAAGAAGGITVAAGSLIQLSALTAKGANNTGTGNGGAGGAISLMTEQITVGGTPYRNGLIKVTGTIDNRGGNAAASRNGDGGAGGTTLIDGGAVIVVGNVIASGGKPGATGTSGPGGNISLHTYALQPLTPNFDLTSNKDVVVALPGALFTVGIAGSPNGVSGFIQTGTQVAPGIEIVNRTVNGTGRVDEASSFGGAIAITVTGTTASIDRSGVGDTIGALNSATNKRTLITPAEAVALFESSRGTQSIALNADGQAIGDSITLTDRDLNATTFTAFNLPSTVILNVSGPRPIISLPSTATIAGTINFSSAVGFINTGSGAFTVQPTGVLSSPNTLVISGTGSTWTNRGQIDVDQLVFARPTSAPFTFVTADGASTAGHPLGSGAHILVAPSTNVGMAMTFRTVASGDFSLPVVFGDFFLPTIYTRNAAANAATTTRNAVINFDQAQQASVSGQLNANSITINALKGTPLVVGGNLSASKNLTLTSGTGELAIDAMLSAGTLSFGANNFASNDLIAKPQIVSAGALLIKATGNIVFGNGNSLISNGANATVTSTAGNIDLGTNNTFRANGGNVVILAKGTVSGGDNTFQAKGIAGTTTGGIEVGSGLTASKLAAAFSKAAGTETNVGALGGASLTNPNGVVIVTQSGGSFALAPASTLTLQRGAMVFHSVGVDSSVNLGASTFVTKSDRPVAQEAVGVDETEYVLDTEIDDRI